MENGKIYEIIRKNGVEIDARSAEAFYIYGYVFKFRNGLNEIDIYDRNGRYIIDKNEKQNIINSIINGDVDGFENLTDYAIYEIIRGKLYVDIGRKYDGISGFETQFKLTNSGITLGITEYGEIRIYDENGKTIYENKKHIINDKNEIAKIIATAVFDETREHDIGIAVKTVDNIIAKFAINKNVNINEYFEIEIKRKNGYELYIDPTSFILIKNGTGYAAIDTNDYEIYGSPFDAGIIARIIAKFPEIL